MTAKIASENEWLNDMLSWIDLSVLLIADKKKIKCSYDVFRVVYYNYPLLLSVVYGPKYFPNVCQKFSRTKGEKLNDTCWTFYLMVTASLLFDLLKHFKTIGEFRKFSWLAFCYFNCILSLHFLPLSNMNS
jgi:hypothetical protein